MGGAGGNELLPLMTDDSRRCIEVLVSSGDEAVTETAAVTAV